MVTISVLLARYQPGVDGQVYGKAAKLERTNEWLQSITMEPRYPNPFFDQSLPEKRDTKKTNIWRKPSKMSGYNASFAVFLLVLSLSCLAAILITVLNNILKGEGWAFLAGGISGLFTLAALIFLTRQPRNNAEFSIMVPCFPWLPIITIFVNILLITELNYLSFVRFGAWLIPGKIILVIFLCFKFFFRIFRVSPEVARKAGPGFLVLVGILSFPPTENGQRTYQILLYYEIFQFGV